MLTPKQDRFCREYVVDLNATRAAKRAGYSERTAYSQGQRLLKNVEISSRVGKLRGEAAKRNDITVDGVIAMLLESYRDAKAANQHGPAVRAAELLGKHLVMFTDRIAGGEDGRMSDEELLLQLAGGNKAKAAKLKDLLGLKRGFTTARHA